MTRGFLARALNMLKKAIDETYLDKTISYERLTILMHRRLLANGELDSDVAEFEAMMERTTWAQRCTTLTSDAKPWIPPHRTQS